MRDPLIERVAARARQHAESQSLDGMDRSAALEEQINVLCRNALTSPDGEQLMLYLRTMTTNRTLPASATDAELRYLEGQRRLVAILDARRVSKPKAAT